MAVVCAGPKAILDVPATLEYLETRGVPVVAIGQADLPGFYARSAGIAAPASVPDVAAAAALVAAHLGLGLAGAILLCVPVPALEALDPTTSRATRSSGRSVTPRRRASRDRRSRRGSSARSRQLTDGASLRANTALIVNDARVAGEIAVQPRIRESAGRRTEARPGPGRRRPGWYPSGPSNGPFPGTRHVRLVRPARHRGAGRSPRLQRQAHARRRPRGRRPRRRARRVLRAARPQRRGQDDAHQDPDDAPAAVGRARPGSSASTSPATSSGSAGS